MYAVPFYITQSHFTQLYTICVYAVPFDITLSHFTQRYTICVYAVPFYITLSYFTQRTPFVRTLCYSTLPCAIWRNATPFVYCVAISCSNSTWATGPFIIYQLNSSCLGCSVSWRKTKPSIIWPCHSFISYSILQLILKPALYLLIYLTSLYFWWWRPPIVHTTVFLLP